MTRNNLSVLLRERLASGDWRRIDSDYSLGSLTAERSNIIQFSLIIQPKAELEAFVREHIDVRAGLTDFVRYCRMRDVPFVIVSSGLDFYIEAVLDSIGPTDVELHFPGNSGLPADTVNGVSRPAGSLSAMLGHLPGCQDTPRAGSCSPADPRGESEGTYFPDEVLQWHSVGRPCSGRWATCRCWQAAK